MNSTRVELDRKWQHILWKCMLITYICVLVIEMGSRIFWKGTVEKGLLGCIVGDIIVTAVVSVLILVITGVQVEEKAKNSPFIVILFILDSILIDTNENGVISRKNDHPVPYNTY